MCIRDSVKYKAWKNNPKEITFKKSLNSPKEKIELSALQSFSIDNVCKFVKATVPINKASNVLDNLERTYSPNLDTSTVLLKQLIEGSKSLFVHREDSKYTFFINKGKTFDMLVYKQFREGSQLKQNLEFIHQLKDELDYEHIYGEKLPYDEKSLKGIFIDYLEKKGESYNEINKTKNKANKAISVKAGVNRANLKINDTFLDTLDKSRVFNEQTSFRFGLELRYILPVNNNKWEFLIESNYQQFKSDSTDPLMDSRINYSSLELLFGFRYKIFLNEKISINFAPYFVYDAPLNKTINVVDTKLTLNDTANLEFSTGLTFNDLISLEIRIASNRNILNAVSASWGAEYRKLALIASYKFMSF